MIPILYNNTKLKVKQYVKQLKYYSLTCDGYSIPSKQIKVMVVFLHEYSNNIFRSILLDVLEMQSNADTKRVMDSVIADYKLDSADVIVTADCARSNIAAFKDNQQGCWCHRFNTASSHMTNSKTSDEKARTFFWNTSR